MDLKIGGRTLEDRLSHIDAFFGTQSLLNVGVETRDIKKYYSLNHLAYKKVHSSEGAVHMAINYDGVFNKSGYYTAPDEIGEYIQQYSIRNVVELGCGKGFNSNYLSSRFPEVQFKGLDITKTHLNIAKKAIQNKTNVEFLYGDFQSIPLPNQCAELVFELEAVCHARNQEKVIQEAHRILKPEGFFILYEAFRNGNFNSMNEKSKLAGYLTERSMVVSEFADENIWLDIAQKNGFEIIENQDISDAIMPNLLRLNRISGKVFDKPLLGKLLKILIPRYILMNAVAGTLMPYVISLEIMKYKRIVMKKI
jgi:ubiquinone/menaquinone biosynthesis C-methylase UbiE